LICPELISSSTPPNYSDHNSCTVCRVMVYLSFLKRSQNFLSLPYCEFLLIPHRVQSTEFCETIVSTNQNLYLKDRRRRPEGGEWEPIKIPHRNLAYIPNSEMVLARPRAKSTTKIRSKNSLYPHRHFTKHLVGTFGKPPRESDLNYEPSSLLDRRLKNYTGFTLQPSTHNRKN
jgi:hypothetical protein